VTDWPLRGELRAGAHLRLGRGAALPGGADRLPILPYGHARRRADRGSGDFAFPRPGQARNTGHGPIIVPRSALITILSDDLAHSGHDLTRAVRHGEYESYSVELA
jgi:hypothetical protein